MKKLVYNSMRAFAAVSILGFIGCKDAKTEADTIDTEITTTETTESTSTATGTGNAESDATADEGSMNGPIQGNSSTDNSGNKVPSDGYSGDGSDGRTSSTAVNTSKNVQMGTNKKSKNLKGYSAPDGTPDENNDGDMYTKHDTTMMPSGSTPIK